MYAIVYILPPNRHLPSGLSHFLITAATCIFPHSSTPWSWSCLPPSHRPRPQPFTDCRTVTAL